MALLQTREMSIRVGDRALITGLNWQVNRGEFWCVLGRNGAGKSMLLHVLSGLRAADEGEVSLDGRMISQIPIMEQARLRGLMPQQITDSFSCAVGEAVSIALTPWRLGSEWDNLRDTEIIQNALTQVGMADRISDDITRLSGGERQRVAFAAMLAQEPELMLFDEPTSHQDVAQQLLLMRLIRQQSEQNAVVATCHDINLAARFATHVLLLGKDNHRAGPASEMLTPDSLQSVFDCAFVRTGDTFMAA
jgi:iron complex transport system ATP-binding protein